MLMRASSANCGAQKFSVAARSAKVASTSSSAMAAATRCSCGMIGRAGRAVVRRAISRAPVRGLGGERLVLEGFEFRRDVALGVLQRLAAAVVVRHVLRIGVRDFDVEAVHAVVFHFQLGDAGAGAFARLQFEEEVAAVGLDGS